MPLKNSVTEPTICIDSNDICEHKQLLSGKNDAIFEFARFESVEINQFRENRSVIQHGLRKPTELIDH